MGFSRYGVGARRLIQSITRTGSRLFITPWSNLKGRVPDRDLFGQEPYSATVTDGEEEVTRSFEVFSDAERWVFAQLVRRINRRRANDVHARIAARASARTENGG